jgi:hypothetical protein
VFARCAGDHPGAEIPSWPTTSCREHWAATTSPTCGQRTDPATPAAASGPHIKLALAMNGPAVIVDHDILNDQPISAINYLEPEHEWDSGFCLFAEPTAPIPSATGGPEDRRLSRRRWCAHGRVRGRTAPRSGPSCLV